jgi:carbon-monoxide dehydrogenase medium subunit
MKPPAFDYVRARTLEEAIDALGRRPGEAKVLAGGQSLTPMLNFRLAHPGMLVDINRVPGLDAIRDDDGGLRIGTLARHRAIEVSDSVRKKFPILTAAAAHVGHLAIRNRGTFGGSIAHADPAAEWPMLALLLDAQLEAKGPQGARTIPAREFFTTFLTTALGDNEILTEVKLPGLPAKTGWGFEELSRRPGDFALAAVAAVVTLDGKTIKDARISMGGVGATPLRAPGAEALLRGKPADAALFEQAGKKAAEESDPSNDVHATADYRRHLVSVLTRRALASAAEKAAQG